MPYPERPKQKTVASRKEPRTSLVLRIDRAAGDVNPFLVVMVIGLLILNLTLYLGMAPARQPTSWRGSHQAEASAAPAAAASPDPVGYSR